MFVSSSLSLWFSLPRPPSPSPPLPSQLSAGRLLLLLLLLLSLVLLKASPCYERVFFLAAALTRGLTGFKLLRSTQRLL